MWKFPYQHTWTTFLACCYCPRYQKVKTFNIPHIDLTMLVLRMIFVENSTQIAHYFDAGWLGSCHSPIIKSLSSIQSYTTTLDLKVMFWTWTEEVQIKSSISYSKADIDLCHNNMFDWRGRRKRNDDNSFLSNVDKLIKLNKVLLTITSWSWWVSLVRTAT